MPDINATGKNIAMMARVAAKAAKVICRAKSREECIVKMDRAMKEFIIEGVKTTIPFHIALMANPEFRAGKYDTGLLERFDYAQAIRDMDFQP